MDTDLPKDGWELVRHVPQGSRWHSASDCLRGTDHYGDPVNGHSPEDPEWTIPFDTVDFDEFLFASGDGTKWLVASKTNVLDKQGAPTKLTSIQTLSVLRGTLQRGLRLQHGIGLERVIALPHGI